MNTQANDVTPQPQPKGSIRAAIDNPLVVLGLLFFVMAILGLPLLWMSRGFSVPAKIGWSIAVTIYTTALIGCTGMILTWTWSRIVESL